MKLAFVRQKPSTVELRDLSQEYLYLMDSGIVLMNAETTMKLMINSGWKEKHQEFKGGSAQILRSLQ